MQFALKPDANDFRRPTFSILTKAPIYPLLSGALKQAENSPKEYPEWILRCYE
jgi:hypothetical protein